MITSLKQRLLEEGRGCFYAAEPDSGSESDSHDPTRECYHIDGQVDPPPQEDRAAQLAELLELKTKLDEDRERLVLLEQILEQDLPYPPGGSVRRRAREVH